ncbi:uncharacterized protein GIQ15_00890 [Arthroderma uncinatum]|uniref:uncharacterized protein n=1 Tax=Arthroderma uncinatum TaxID=74035 RepID=UPI00144AC7F4|nr:uncharacterized protein GIQ15_00890 [Arthroderma uncinatum]KAF3491373.1 hypothetical protein GIQ15_00890 [Arthroderma uncinatum]
MAGLPKRIIKETERLMAEPVPGINAVPHEDNLRYFDVRIHGPTQSPYEALQIRTILLSIQALLGAPNPDDPLANDVAQRWKEDEPAAIQTAREWTKTHAMV